MTKACVALALLSTLPLLGQNAVPSSSRFLQLHGELRARAEHLFAGSSEPSPAIALSRLRLSATLSPNPLARFHFQFQDARAFTLFPAGRFPDSTNPVEPRLAYAEFGQLESGSSPTGWRLRAGRQELPIGDERLVGADSYWDCFGLTFDAARVTYSQARFRLDAFTGYRVQPSPLRADSPDRDSRIAGVTAAIPLQRPESVVETYVLWKRGGQTSDLQGQDGHRDVLSPGLRLQTPLPRSLDLNLELVRQFGHVVRDRIQATAAHLEIGWSPSEDDSGPRLSAEFNYASGDPNPRDALHQTFDDLYPAGFNKFGIVDPFAWRNIRYPALALDLPLSRTWAVYVGYRSYWLADRTDGLYNGCDRFLVRNPFASSSRLGDHWLASAAFIPNSYSRFYAGYGYLRPGPYLRESGYPSPLHTVYLLTSFSF